MNFVRPPVPAPPTMPVQHPMPSQASMGYAPGVGMFYPGQPLAGPPLSYKQDCINPQLSHAGAGYQAGSMYRPQYPAINPTMPAYGYLPQQAYNPTPLQPAAGVYPPNPTSITSSPYYYQTQRSPTVPTSEAFPGKPLYTTGDSTYWSVTPPPSLSSFSTAKTDVANPPVASPPVASPPVASCVTNPVANPIVSPVYGSSIPSVSPSRPASPSFSSFQSPPPSLSPSTRALAALISENLKRQLASPYRPKSPISDSTNVLSRSPGHLTYPATPPSDAKVMQATTVSTVTAGTSAPFVSYVMPVSSASTNMPTSSSQKGSTIKDTFESKASQHGISINKTENELAEMRPKGNLSKVPLDSRATEEALNKFRAELFETKAVSCGIRVMDPNEKSKPDKPSSGMSKSQDDNMSDDTPVLSLQESLGSMSDYVRENDEELGIRGNNLMRLLARTRSLSESSLGSYFSDIDFEPTGIEGDEKQSALEEMIEKLVAKAISEAVSEVLFENQCKLDVKSDENKICEENNKGIEKCKDRDEECEKVEKNVSEEVVTEENEKGNEKGDETKSESEVTKENEINKLKCDVTSEEEHKKDEENVSGDDCDKIEEKCVKKDETVSERLSFKTEKDLKDDASSIDLNPRSPVFKPRKLKEWAQEPKIESDLNPSVPEFTPLSFSLSQHSDLSLSGSDPGYMYNEDYSSYSGSRYPRTMESHMDMYLSHNRRTYPKNRSIQTDSAVLIDTASNTRQVKLKDQGMETKSCDNRDVCINTMESYEIEEDDRVINIYEKKDQETMTTKKKTKSKVTMVTDEDPDLESVPSPRKAYEIGLREKLLKTQGELLRLRGKVCLDELHKQIHQLEKNKNRWEDQFSSLYQFRPLASVIDTQISKLKVDVQILKGKLKSCEDQLEAGEMLIPDVPCFAVSLPIGPTEVHVVNRERMPRIHSSNEDQSTRANPFASTSPKHSVINSASYTELSVSETSNINDVYVKQGHDLLSGRGKANNLLKEDANTSMGFEPSVDRIDLASTGDMKVKPSDVGGTFDQPVSIKPPACLDPTKPALSASLQHVPETKFTSIPQQQTSLLNLDKFDEDSDELQPHLQSPKVDAVSTDFDYIPTNTGVLDSSSIASRGGWSSISDVKRDIDFNEHSQETNMSSNYTDSASNVELDLNVPSKEQEQDVKDSAIEEESLSVISDNLTESKEGAVDIPLSKDKTSSMSEQNQLPLSSLGATAETAVPTQPSQAAVDPKLFESVLNELMKAYPHLTANPLVLQSIAMQQTLVLQEFISRNSGQVLPNLAGSSNDLTLQPSTSNLNLGSVRENSPNESVDTVESGASKAPPGFTEKVDEIPDQDLNADIASESALLESLMAKSPDKKKKLISIPLPCNPLGIPSVNTSPTKSATGSINGDQAGTSKLPYNLSMSNYVHVTAGAQDGSPEKDRGIPAIDTVVEGTRQNSILSKNTDELSKEVDWNDNNLEVEKSEPQLSSANEQSKTLNKAPNTDYTVSDRKDNPNAQISKPLNESAWKQTTNNYSSSNSNQVLNQWSNAENIAPKSNKVASAAVVNGDQMSGKVKLSTKTSQSKALDTGKDQGDWWGTESDHMESHDDHVTNTKSHDYDDHVTSTKSHNLTDFGSQGVSGSKVKDWLEGVSTFVEEPAPKMPNAWLNREKVKAIDPFTPKWMRSPEAKPPKKSQLDPFAPKWMESEAALGTSMASSDSLRMRRECVGGLETIPPVPETAAAPAVSQKEKEEVKDDVEETKEETEDWTQVTKKGKKQKPDTPPPPPAPVVKQKKLVQMVTNKAVKEQRSNNFERLIAKLQEVPKFASYTREGIIELITVVRSERGGLSGLTTMDIVNAALQVASRPSFERRFKPQMADVVQSGKKPMLPTPTNTRNPLLPLPPYPSNTAMTCYNQTDDEDICVICHDGLSTEATKVLECGHVFHNGCIKEWVLGREMTCPTCRRHVLFPEDFPKLGK